VDFELERIQELSGSRIIEIKGGLLVYSQLGCIQYLDRQAARVIIILFEPFHCIK
jgi:hypothetical protein